MRKNKTIRAAALMLVLTLITTCFVGGTFAKYTTGADADDTARVAKWGVTASVTGGAFSETYDVEEDVEDAFELSVESSTDDKLVAPGTKGTFTGVALTGTPEVAVRITKTATVAVDGWTVDDAFYCPIVVTINDEEISGLQYTESADFVADIKEAIEAGSNDYKPNTDLSAIDDMNGDYAWEWAFVGNDKSDTALGDLATAPTISIDVDVVVEQID